MTRNWNLLQCRVFSCGFVISPWFHQLISQPTHLMPQSFSCIDLLFTNQPNLTVDKGIHPSLYSNYYHQITYWKLSINVKYPPPYERLVWDYNKTNLEGMKKSGDMLLY